MAYSQYRGIAVTDTAAHSPLNRNNAAVCMLESMHMNDTASLGPRTVTHLAKWHLCPSHTADWPGPVNVTLQLTVDSPSQLRSLSTGTPK